MTWVYYLTVICHFGIISLRKKNKAYSILGIIKRNFIYMDDTSFILLYLSLIHISEPTRPY